MIQNVRLERHLKGQKKIGNWKWKRQSIYRHPTIQRLAGDDGVDEQLGFEG